MMKRKHLLLAIFAVTVLLMFKFLFFPQPQEYKFERIYPEKIKLVYTNMLSMHGPLSEDESNAILKENLPVKELNVNTYHLDDVYTYQNGNFIRNPDVRENTIKELVAAKNNNLSIRLAASWGYYDPQLKNVNEVRDFLKKYADILVEEAKFAEKYKVEYFSLFEPDHLVWNQPFDVNESEVANVVNEFVEYVVPRIRKFYKGKIEFQIGNADVWNFTKLNVSRLDYFGVLIGGTCDFEFFKEKVDEIFSKAESLSESSGVPWTISELWINKFYNEYVSCDLSNNRSKYYEYVFEKTRNAKNLKGIMIDSWNIDEVGFETSIKNTEAEQTIKNFFETWN